MGVVHDLDAEGKALCGPRAVVKLDAKERGWPGCGICRVITKRALKVRKDRICREWPGDWGRIKDVEQDGHGAFV